jgi:nitrogen-specific signal transduction histidine kinase
MRDKGPWSDEELLHLSSVQEIFGGFAHEVAQPLNAIMIASQVLQLKVQRSSLSSDEKSFVSQRLAIVAAQVQRATQIVDGLRHFVVREAECGGPADIAGVYERIRSLMDQQFMGRGIELRLEASGGLPPIRTAPHTAEAVLVQCLAFARDSLEAIALRHEGRSDPFQEVAVMSFRSDRGMSVVLMQWGMGSLREGEYPIDPEDRMGLVTARSVLRSRGGDLRTTPSSLEAVIP